MQVYHSGLKEAMTKQLFYGVDVTALIQEVGGKTVTQRMKAESRVETGFLYCILHKKLHGTVTHTAAFLTAVE